MDQLTNLFSSTSLSNLLDLTSLNLTNIIDSTNFQENLTTLLNSTTTNIQTNLSNLLDTTSSNLQTNLSNLLDTTTTNLQTNLSNLLDSTSSNLQTNLTNLIDYIYSESIDSSRTDNQILDENFTVITGDSEILNILKAITRQGMVSVGEYENDLFNSINELTNNLEYEYDDFFEIILQVILKKIIEQIGWARLSIHFQNLENSDKLLLLKNSWSSNLLLDNLYQRIHHNLPDQMTLANGQQFNLISLALLGENELSSEWQLQEIQTRLTDLKFDYVDYVFMKFLLLLDLDLTRLDLTIDFKNWKYLVQSNQQIEQVFDHITTKQNCFINDKFKILMTELMPEIKKLAFKQEQYIVKRYKNGDVIPDLILELINGKNNLDFVDRIKRTDPYTSNYF